MSQPSPLSERQQAILDFIPVYIDKHGYPPSIRDIGAKVGIASSSAVARQLKVLENKGYIHRNELVSRGLRLVQPTTTQQGWTAQAASDMRATINNLLDIHDIRAEVLIEAVEGGFRVAVYPA
jgi:SOS-response transcriptional repressor LexA